MKIRRRYFSDVRGNPQQQKAVSLALYLKSKLGRSSTITNYTPNKVRTMTGVCQKTFLRYLPLMVEMELVSFAGRHNEHLVINRLSSKTKMRNIDVAKFCYKSFTEVYRSLRAFIVLLIQSRKDYIKRTLQAAHAPKHSDDCKAARREVKRLVRNGTLKDVNEKYNEYGTSYKRMAKETGNCERTTENIIKYAIKKRWVKKTVNIIQTFMRGVMFTDVPGYDFTTKNNGYELKANMYRLMPSIARSLTNNCAGSY